jgi:hypothetical protein
MPKVICPSCRKKLRPPDRLAGRRITCPRCDEVLVVPVELPEEVQDVEDVETPSAPEDPPLPPSARLGLLGLILGVASILLLCVPFIGYLSIGLSIAGLLSALAGLWRVRPEDKVAISSEAVRGAGLPGNFGTRARDYPLAGMVACFLALILALLPALFR